MNTNLARYIGAVSAQLVQIGLDIHVQWVPLAASPATDAIAITVYRGPHRMTTHARSMREVETAGPGVLDRMIRDATTILSGAS